MAGAAVTGGIVGSIDDLARETGFSGVIRLDDGDEVLLEAAYGMADRAHGIAMDVDTRIGVASGSKAFTALVIHALVEAGTLSLATPVREVLGDDLALIDDRVTVGHLLAHRSGIGDYLDEEALESIDDHVLAVPVHTLDTSEAFVPVLDGHPQVAEPGEVFAYCNGGYVVLAVMAERVTGRTLVDLVDGIVCRPAGLTATGLLRTDSLPGDAAIGYVVADGLRSNLLHLPVVPTGDGGAHTTALDVRRFWLALFEGRIVRPASVVAAVTPISIEVDTSHRRYGLGFYLASEGAVVMLEGYDAGASFRTQHDPGRRRTATILSNTSEGAWPVAKLLDGWAGAPS